MNLSQPLVTNLQTPVPVEPTVRPLHHPAMPPQLLARFYPLARYPWGDASLVQLAPLLPRVISFVSVQLRGPLSWTAPRPLDRADGIKSLFKHFDVMNVRGRDRHRERDALGFDHNMALRALFAAIRRILPGLSAPFCAGTAEESSEARDQSIRSASPSLSSSTWCSLFHTPAWCHCLSLRQHVMPEPQPISGGRYSQGSPVESTNRMPRSTSRFGMRGRPPLVLGGSGGNKGSMTAQSSSLINCLAMPCSLHGQLRFC